MWRVVQVKLAAGSEECAVVVAIWRPSKAQPAYYSIHNYTRHDLEWVFFFLLFFPICLSICLLFGDGFPVGCAVRACACVPMFR